MSSPWAWGLIWASGDKNLIREMGRRELPPLSERVKAQFNASGVTARLRRLEREAEAFDFTQRMKALGYVGRRFQSVDLKLIYRECHLTHQRWVKEKTDGWIMPWESHEVFMDLVGDTMRTYMSIDENDMDDIIVSLLNGEKTRFHMQKKFVKIMINLQKKWWHCG